MHHRYLCLVKHDAECETSAHSTSWLDEVGVVGMALRDPVPEWFPQQRKQEQKYKEEDHDRQALQSRAHCPVHRED